MGRRTKRTLDEILADVMQSDDCDRADAAIRELERAADKTWLPRLRELLATPGDFYLREVAAFPVARLDGAAALPLLIRAQWMGRDEGHDNDGIDHVIGETVGSDPAVAGRWISVWITDADPRLREAAAWLWGFLPRHLPLEPLLGAATDDDAAVRAAAAGSLSEWPRDRRAVDAALVASSDDDVIVRSCAAGSLSEFRDRRAIERLAQLRTDPDEAVRRIADEQYRLALRNRGRSSPG